MYCLSASTAPSAGADLPLACAGFAVPYWVGVCGCQHGASLKVAVHRAGEAFPFCRWLGP